MELMQHRLTSRAHASVEEPCGRLARPLIYLSPTSLAAVIDCSVLLLHPRSQVHHTRQHTPLAINTPGGLQDHYNTLSEARHKGCVCAYDVCTRYVELQ
jgi:hypothetical protein